MNKKELLDGAIRVGLIYVVIGVIWIGAEYLFMGERVPRLRDDFIALGLSLLIYLGWRNLWIVKNKDRDIRSDK